MHRHTRTRLLTHALTHTWILPCLSLSTYWKAVAATSRSLSSHTHALLPLLRALFTATKSSSFCFCAKCRKKLDLDYFLCERHCESRRAREQQSERARIRVRNKFKLNVVVAAIALRCARSACGLRSLSCYRCSPSLSLSRAWWGVTICAVSFCFLWGSHAFCYCLSFCRAQFACICDKKNKTLRGHWKLIEFCISYNEMAKGMREVRRGTNKRCILCSHMFTCSIFVLQFYCVSVNFNCSANNQMARRRRAWLGRIMKLNNMMRVLCSYSCNQWAGKGCTLCICVIEVMLHLLACVLYYWNY